MKRSYLNFAPIFTIFLVVAAWWIAAVLINKEIILPEPHKVIKTTFILFGQKSFYMALVSTFNRVIISFLAAIVFAILFAVLASQSKFFNKLFYPLLVIVRATPTVSMTLLFIVWFSSSVSPTVVSFAVIFPMLYSSLLTAINECDPSVTLMSDIYKVPKKQRIFDFFLPSVFNRAYSDSISTLSLNVKLIVAAEALAQTGVSLGDSMKMAKETLETTELFAFTIVAVLGSVLLEGFLHFVRYAVRRTRYAKA